MVYPFDHRPGDQYMGLVAGGQIGEDSGTDRRLAEGPVPCGAGISKGAFPGIDTETP